MSFHPNVDNTLSSGPTEQDTSSRKSVSNSRAICRSVSVGRIDGPSVGRYPYFFFLAAYVVYTVLLIDRLIRESVRRKDTVRSQSCAYKTFLKKIEAQHTAMKAAYRLNSRRKKISQKSRIDGPYLGSFSGSFPKVKRARAFPSD